MREVLDKDAVALWAASWVWGDMPRKNLIVWKPQQFGGHGLNTGRSAIEEEEKEEEEE